MVQYLNQKESQNKILTKKYAKPSIIEKIPVIIPINVITLKGNFECLTIPNTPMS